VDAEVLGVRAKIASVRDVTQGKLWAYGDPRRRLSKRKKDELESYRNIKFRLRIHRSGERSRRASLATETRASAVGASRLKGGCSQDWLPH
jgi:hypothetical protein